MNKSSRLLIDEPPLQVLPSLAKLIGLNEAIFLQQLHYWLTPSAKYKPHYREYKGETLPWIFNTYHNKTTKAGDETGWQANFPFWSDRTIKRIVSSLRDKGLVITTDQFNDHYTNRTLWYTIDRNNLAKLDGTLDSDNLSPSDSDNLSPSDSDKLSPSRQRLPKTTTDILPPQNSQTNGNASNGSPSDNRSAKIERLASAIAKAADNDNKLFVKGVTQLALDICKLCGLDIMTIVSRKTQEALVSITIALYMHKVSEDDLNNFNIWWYDNTWQGKKGQPPTPEAIGDSWGQYETQKVVNVPAISTDGGFYV